MKVHTAGVDMAAERYQLTQASGSWRLVAQQSGRDGDDFVVTLMASMDADGALQSLDYVRTGADGAATRAQLRTEGDLVVLDGIGADGSARTSRARAARYLGCDLAACIAPMLPELRSLRPGERQELSVLTLDVFPQLAVAAERWTLVRDADRTRSAAEIEIVRGAAKRRVRVRWDDRGLVAVVNDGDLGDVEAVRVELP